MCALKLSDGAVLSLALSISTQKRAAALIFEGLSSLMAEGGERTAQPHQGLAED